MAIRRSKAEEDEILAAANDIKARRALETNADYLRKCAARGTGMVSIWSDKELLYDEVHLPPPVLDEVVELVIERLAPFQIRQRTR